MGVVKFDRETIVLFVNDEISRIPELEHEGLTGSDLEDVAAMAAAASNAWLFRDLEDNILISTEEKWRRDAPGTPFCSVFGTTDLRLLNSVTRRRKLIDWKSAGDAGSKVTLDRYKHSWQRKIYQWATRDPEFCYRLVQKPEAAEPTYGLAVREVNFTVDDWVEHDKLVATYLQQAFAAYRAMTSWTKPWLMRAPSGCNAYNRPCARMGTCPAHGGTAPEDMIRPEQEIELNNSGIEAFWLCPERYRQNLLIGMNAESSRDTCLGRLFHAVMENIYRRCFAERDRLVEAA